MKTVLLTGSTGFVGNHLKNHLVRSGYHVTSLLRGEKPTGTYDIIINCAAELDNESKMKASNVNLVKRLLDFAHKNKIGKFIQIGSSAEYGQTNQVRFESIPCAPETMYAKTKFEATQLCLKYSNDFDMDIVIARPFSLYGPNDKPRKLIPRLYNSYVSHDIVSLFPAGHDWLYIDDFCEGILCLIRASRSVTQGQIFNFGTGVNSTNNDVLEALEDALGGQLYVANRIGKMRSYDVDNWVADITKARTMLGWEPKYTLASGMKEYVMKEWFKNR